jgi:hypothetical protein
MFILYSAENTTHEDSCAVHDIPATLCRLQSSRLMKAYHKRKKIQDDYVNIPTYMKNIVDANTYTTDMGELGSNTGLSSKGILISVEVCISFIEQIQKTNPEHIWIESEIHPLRNDPLRKLCMSGPRTTKGHYKIYSILKWIEECQFIILSKENDMYIKLIGESLYGISTFVHNKYTPHIFDTLNKYAVVSQRAPISPVYNPCSPISPVYNPCSPISPVYNPCSPISPVYNPCSPISPVYNPCSPISPVYTPSFT